MKQNFLMCTPDYFDIEYVINPWMNLNNRVDKALAKKQWNCLVTTLKSLGCGIEIIEGAPGLPDMTFAGDCGIMLDGVFLASNFRHPQRKNERAHYISWFKERGHPIIEIPSDIYFEGLGDIIIAENRVVFGHGPRSHHNAMQWIKKCFPNIEISATVEITDERFFHLAMAAGLLDKDTIIFYEKAFKHEDILQIKSAFKNVISANDHDVLNNIICNNIPVGKNIVCHDCSSELEAKLAKLGFTIIRCNVSEFKKSGASLRCLVFNL